MSRKDELNFIAEAGMLKRVKRTGWWMAGIPFDESVADHSFRCAVIAYVLSKMENIDPYKTVIMSLFGDLPEARINDAHKVANKYLNSREVEKDVYDDQIDSLNKKIKLELKALRYSYEAQKTREAIIARDADILECLIQAKEYSDLGFKPARKFFKKAPAHLKSSSARKLWAKSASWDSSTWWESLTKFDRL